MALLELDDYIDRAVDPTPGNPFFPVVVHDELLEAAELSPAAELPASVQPEIVRARVTSALRLQQFLVYRVGKQLGVLGPTLPKVLGALQSVPMMEAAGDAALALEAAASAAGAASNALGAVPIVGWIVQVATAGVKMALNLDWSMNTPGTRIGPTLPLAQGYSSDADASLANERLLSQANSRDWTSLFLPSMRGKLAAQIRNDPAGRIVIAWGLRDNGIVPRVIIDDKPLGLLSKKPYTWHFSEHDEAGPFSASGGLGAVPGTAQIVDVTQSTLQELQNLHRGHESLGDPRCGSDVKTGDVNVGSFYPTTASGAWSLFGYATKASASTYTIATQAVADAWQSYVDEIWEGIENLWRNESWESGWGCGPWQNALQGLAAAHCVGSDGILGGFGAWRPTRYTTKLTAADRNAWEKNNLYTRIVKPAMIDLRQMQLGLLRTTPMAAYLPSHGLGAFDDPKIREAFEAARIRILQRPARNKQLRRPDVVDDWYRESLVAAGVGSETGDGGIADSDYKPPRIAMPSGGVSGRGAAVLIGGGALAAAAVALVIRARRRR